MRRSASSVVLGLDTSGPVGSVAVGRGGTILAHGSITRPAGHAAGLVPLIGEVLDRAGVGLREVHRIVVGEGPGSFTGVRVAAATAKGLSHGLGVPLHAASSLAGVAMATDTGAVRYALFDARGQRVYGACYDVGPSGVRTLVAPHAGDVAALFERHIPADAVFTGDGALRHRSALLARGFTVADEPDHPLAVGLLRYAFRQPDAAPVADAASWEPEYVRASSAERLWGR